VLANPACYTQLKIERYRKGILQKHLAAVADVHVGSLATFENGCKVKKAHTGQALAAALSNDNQKQRDGRHSF
jgi:hypothetical protein